MPSDGLIDVAATGPVPDIVTRLEAALAAKGVTQFARIDHAAGAAAVGLDLPPTTVVIFGNAKAGTPLMQAQRGIALDLPLKMLVWQDAARNTWLTYQDPAWLARRHGLDPGTQQSIAGMTTLLAALAREAAAKP